MSDDVDEVYEAFHEAVGMDEEQAEEWLENPTRKEASGGDADKHIERNLEILSTPKSEWEDKEISQGLALTSARSRKVIDQARKTVAFKERHDDGHFGDYVSREHPYSRKEIALWNWLINEMEGRPVRQDFSYLGGLGGLRPIVGRQGGKFKLRDRIVDVIPDHEIYVEPFVGGGSVFFYKNPAEEAVISDVDSDLMAFYKAVPRVDVEDVDMKPSESRFEDLRDQLQEGSSRTWSDAEAAFENFLYVNKYSYAQKMKTYYRPEGGERSLKYLRDHWREYQSRLYHTRVLTQDFREVIEKYDRSRAFFYMDPPYHGTDQEGYDEGSEALTAEDVLEAIQGIKGKFLLSYKYSADLEDLFSDFKTHQIYTSYTLSKQKDHEKKAELLVSNYPIDP